MATDRGRLIYADLHFSAREFLLLAALGHYEIERPVIHSYPLFVSLCRNEQRDESHTVLFRQLIVIFGSQYESYIGSEYLNRSNIIIYTRLSFSQGNLTEQCKAWDGSFN